MNNRNWCTEINVFVLYALGSNKIMINKTRKVWTEMICLYNYWTNIIYNFIIIIVTGCRYVDSENFWFETPCRIHLEYYLYTLYQLYEYDWQDCNATSQKEMIESKNFCFVIKENCYHVIMRQVLIINNYSIIG